MVAQQSSAIVPFTQYPFDVGVALQPGHVLEIEDLETSPTLLPRSRHWTEMVVRPGAAAASECLCCLIVSAIACQVKRWSFLFLASSGQPPFHL